MPGAGGSSSSSGGNSVTSGNIGFPSGNTEFPSGTTGAAFPAASQGGSSGGGIDWTAALPLLQTLVQQETGGGGNSASRGNGDGTVVDVDLNALLPVAEALMGFATGGAVGGNANQLDFGMLMNLAGALGGALSGNP
ncbi:unnamed protein product [Closterium sp. NIES-53]